MTALTNQIPGAMTARGTTVPKCSEDNRAIVKGLMLALTTLFSWTAAPLLLSDLASEIDMHTSNGSRFLICFTCLIPFLAMQAYAGTVTLQTFKQALIPAGIMTIGQLGFVGSFYYISATTATFAVRTQMLAAALFAALLFADERRVIRRPSFIIGAVFLLIGSFGMAAFGDGGFGESNTIAGVILACMGGIFYGLYGVATRYFLTATSPSNENPVKGPLAFAVVCAEAGLIFLIIMIIFSNGPVDQLRALSLVQWIKLLASVLTGLWSGHTAYFMSFQYIGVSVSTGVIQLQPVTVGIGSLIFYSETFTGAQLVSGFIAISGAIAMVVTKALNERDLRLKGARDIEMGKKEIVAQHSPVPTSNPLTTQD
jgi:drug/metabolite transporter (DMT)-like permease